MAARGFVVVGWDGRPASQLNRVLVDFAANACWLAACIIRTMLYPAPLTGIHWHAPDLAKFPGRKYPLKGETQRKHSPHGDKG